MMGNLDVGAGFLAWQRLQLGWLDPVQVSCFASADSRDVRVSPIEQAGGTKAVIVQTGSNDFTVAENRQATAEDVLLCDAGMLVDHGRCRAIESGYGSIRVQPAAPDNGTKSVTRCGPLYNAAFKRGRRGVRERQRPYQRQCRLGCRPRRARGVQPAALVAAELAVPAGRADRRDRQRLGDGQARVDFAAPGGDVPVLWYTATASPGGRSASGMGSPITVGGLENGTSYTFTVRRRAERAPARLGRVGARNPARRGADGGRAAVRGVASRTCRTSRRRAARGRRGRRTPRSPRL